jgi:hypothetical protein
MNILNRSKPLAVYPEIEEIPYASKIISSDLNKQLKSIEESALRALLRSRDISTELSRIQAGVVKSYEAMATKYGQILYQQGNTAYATAYNIINNMTAKGKVLYDRHYGYITLNPIGSYSVIPRGERYDGKVSPQVDITLNDVTQPKDSVIYDALDGSNRSFWMADATAGDHVLQIDLPPALTKRFNYIELYPFPLYGMNIKKIEYQDFHSKRWDITKNIYGTNPLQNNVGEGIKLYLSPKEFNGTLYITVEATTLGVIGFSNIDVKFLDYNNTTQNGYIAFDTFATKTKPYSMRLGKAVVDFYFDSPTAQSMITDTTSPIKCTFLQGTESNGVITPGTWSHEVNLADAATLDLNNVAVTLESNENIYLTFELTEHSMTTPVLRGAKLNYTEV